MFLVGRTTYVNDLHFSSRKATGVAFILTVVTGITGSLEILIIQH